MSMKITVVVCAGAGLMLAIAWALDAYLRPSMLMELAGWLFFCR